MFIKYNSKCIITFHNNAVVFPVKYLITLINFSTMPNVNITWLVSDTMVGFLSDHLSVTRFKIEKVKFLYPCINFDTKPHDNILFPHFFFFWFHLRDFQTIKQKTENKPKGIKSVDTKIQLLEPKCKVSHHCFLI